MKKNKGTLAFWSLLSLVFLAVLGMVAYQFSQMGGGPDPSKFPKKVDTQLVQLRPVDITYTTQGMIEARNRIDMNVEVAGTVASIEVEEGQSVRRGQVLLRLRAGRQNAKEAESDAGIKTASSLVASRKAELRQARANLHLAQAGEELAASEYQRYEKLYKDDFVSALELDQKRLAFKAEAARLESANDALARAIAQEAQANSQYSEADARHHLDQVALDETVIRAPFSGVVGEEYVDLGDYVLPTEKVLTLVDSEEMKVAFEVPERFIPYLKEGLSAQVTMNELLERDKNKPEKNKFKAKVTFVSPVVRLENRMVTVKAKLSHDDPEVFKQLRDGQFTLVVLTLFTKPESLVIPEESLVPQGEKFFVYLSENKKAVFREVKLGQREDGWVEVVQGLKAGDNLVISGLQKLFEGVILINKKEIKKNKENKLNSDRT